MGKPLRTGAEALRYAAEMRAAIMAHFANKPSTYIASAKQVAQEINKTPAEVAYYLKAMRDNNLLGDAGKRGREYLFRRAALNGGPPSAAEAQVTGPAQPQLVRTPKLPKTPASQPSAPQDIELQFGSTSVVIGKNPVTGRIRIIIDTLE